MSIKSKYKSDSSTERPSVVSEDSSRTSRARYNYRNPEGSGSFLLYENKSSRFDVSTAYHDEYNKEQGFANSQHTLPYLTGYLLASSLEDAVASITMLTECNTNLQLLMVEADMKSLIASKYQIEEEIVTDELANIKPNMIHSNFYKLKKLESDRKYITDFLQCLCCDLVSRLNYRLLIHETRMVIANADQKQRSLEQNQATIRELKRTLQAEKQRNRLALYECDSQIDTLKFRINDKELQSTIELRYWGNFKGARLEEESTRLGNKEKVYSDSITHNSDRWEKENKVNLEIHHLYDILIEETLQKTEEIMEKYEQDTEKMNMDLHNARHKYAQMLDKRRRLEWTLQHHNELMAKWNQFKEDRRQRTEYEDTMHASCLIVQAWWRGLLVRKQLGPYRPRRERKVRETKKAASSISTGE